MNIRDNTYNLLSLLAAELRRPHFVARTSLSPMFCVSASDSYGVVHAFILDAEELIVYRVHRFAESDSTTGRRYNFRCLMDAVQYISHGFMVLDCME